MNADYIKVPSPCISVCTMDEQKVYCKGCWRTVDEVASWLYYTDDEKKRVLQLLDKRKQHKTP